MDQQVSFFSRSRSAEHPSRQSFQVASKLRVYQGSATSLCLPANSISEWTEPDGTKIPAYVSDGNFVYKTKDGTLLILWSSFKNGKYCVAISRSASGKLAGPWTCDPEPIFEEDGGHPMVFKDFDGNLKLVFHQPNSGHSHPVILPLEDTGNSLVIKK